MHQIPPYLRKGDTIGIICPSGYMPRENMQACIEALTTWGYAVEIGKTAGNRYNYFSGTDEERLADLQSMLDDDNIKAILCARGGYGLTRIIDKVNFKRFKKRPKWFIGYSDITAFHYHLYNKYKIAGLHSPMAAAFNEVDINDKYLLSLQQALKGKSMKYDVEPHIYNIKGNAEGILVGGNLSIISHLLGTPSDVDTKNKILFLEDVGEYIYHIDRMMMQLKRSDKLSSLAGLIIGGFTDMKDTVLPFGCQVYEAILEKVKDFGYPVCFDFPVGHSQRNFALKVGVRHKLSVQNKVTLKEV